MYGAILGDMIGAPYEFDHNNIKTKDFPLFSRGSQFTDDSVMTIAVAEALLGSDAAADDDRLAFYRWGAAPLQQLGERLRHEGLCRRMAL